MTEGNNYESVNKKLKFGKLLREALTRIPKKNYSNLQ
jgi:hypothetical protein